MAIDVSLTMVDAFFVCGKTLTRRRMKNAKACMRLATPTNTIQGIEGIAAQMSVMTASTCRQKRQTGVHSVKPVRRHYLPSESNWRVSIKVAAPPLRLWLIFQQCLQIFARNFVQPLDNKTYTMSPRFVKVCLTVRELCCFNQDNTNFSAFERHAELDL